jgi:hypothetical protein
VPLGGCYNGAPESGCVGAEPGRANGVLHKHICTPVPSSPGLLFAVNISLNFYPAPYTQYIQYTVYTYTTVCTYIQHILSFMPHIYSIYDMMWFIVLPMGSLHGALHESAGIHGDVKAIQ